MSSWNISLDIDLSGSLAVIVFSRRNLNQIWNKSFPIYHEIKLSFLSVPNTIESKWNLHQSICSRCLKHCTSSHNLAWKIIRIRNSINSKVSILWNFTLNRPVIFIQYKYWKDVVVLLKGRMKNFNCCWRFDCKWHRLYFWLYINCMRSYCSSFARKCRSVISITNTKYWEFCMRKFNQPIGIWCEIFNMSCHSKWISHMSWI